MSGRGRQADGPVANTTQRIAAYMNSASHPPAATRARPRPGLVEGAVVQCWKAALGAVADV
jgi:hypothetical protein